MIFSAYDSVVQFQHLDNVLIGVDEQFVFLEVAEAVLFVEYISHLTQILLTVDIFRMRY